MKLEYDSTYNNEKRKYLGISLIKKLQDLYNKILKYC